MQKHDTAISEIYGSNNYIIRWLIRRDLDEIIEIEEDSFEYPWNKNDFVESLRKSNTIGFVAEQNEIIIGYLIYALNKNNIEILNLAVKRDFRRNKVGTSLINKVKSKLIGNRNRSKACLIDSNLVGHLFLKSNNFKAIDIIKNKYENINNDCYKFVYKKEKVVNG